MTIGESPLLKSRIVTDLNCKNNAIRVFVEILLRDASPRIYPKHHNREIILSPSPLVHLLLYFKKNTNSVCSKLCKILIITINNDEQQSIEFVKEILEDPMKISSEFH